MAKISFDNLRVLLDRVRLTLGNNVPFVQNDNTFAKPHNQRQIMIDNPTDREKDMGAALAAMGGEMISYFWGLADGKNYITVRFPDDPGMVQAMYISRLSQGVLKDYRFIELMTSADMVEALKRVPEFSTPVE